MILHDNGARVTVQKLAYQNGGSDMGKGLLVDSDCDGSPEALEAAAAECDADADATDPVRIAAALGWQTRDLDRFQRDGTWGSRW